VRGVCEKKIEEAKLGRDDKEKNNFQTKALFQNL
jgi:hypothetical protein